MKKVTMLVAAGLMAVSSMAMAESTIHAPNSVVAFAASTSPRGSAVAFYIAKTEAEARAGALRDCRNDNEQNNLGGVCKVEQVFSSGCGYATITKDDAPVKDWVLSSSVKRMRALCAENGLDCRTRFAYMCNRYLP